MEEAAILAGISKVRSVPNNYEKEAPGNSAQGLKMKMTKWLLKIKKMTPSQINECLRILEKQHEPDLNYFISEFKKELEKRKRNDDSRD